jgi:septum formation protein
LPLIPTIYLASASPRRQKLLRQIGADFEVLPADVPEHALAREAPADYVRRLAVNKARFGLAELGRRGLPERPVLGADTCVAVDGEILGKPRDRADGLAMLRRLSGRGHEVLTGICVIARDACGQTAEHSAVNVSQVTFAALSERDLADYWASGEPADKAGGYAIQGRAAGFIERLEGSYSGVMGLPLHELTQILIKLGPQA